MKIGLTFTPRAVISFATIAALLLTMTVSAQRTSVRSGKAPRPLKSAGTAVVNKLGSGPITTSFGQDFDNFSSLATNGWFFRNNSTQVGTGDWAQGDGVRFPAQLGASGSFASCTYLSGANASDVSNWMLTPEVQLVNGDRIEFWTRSENGQQFVDRLEVRLSTSGPSTNVGTQYGDVGDFTTLLVEVNPTLSTSPGYPSVWTRFSATISGLGGATSGRIGFRYFVPNAGPSGTNGDYIGIDSFRYYKTPGPVNFVIEDFDDVPTMIERGWYFTNNSNPAGNRTWLQGNSTVFLSQQGGADSFVGAGFESGASVATISDWMLSPPVVLRNGDQIRFWTRTVDPTNFPDRLEVRMSTNGNSTNVGAGAMDVGDFNTLLLTVNPALTTTDYPRAWTEYVLFVSGLPAPTVGRVGFRYFVTDAGPLGNNADYIGIDTFRYQTIAPTSAGVRVSGVVRSTDGRVISGALVLLTADDGTVRSARTNSFGRYQIEGIQSGRTYVLDGSAKGQRFTQRIMEVTDNVVDADLTASGVDD